MRKTVTPLFRGSATRWNLDRRMHVSLSRLLRGPSTSNDDLVERPGVEGVLPGPLDPGPVDEELFPVAQRHERGPFGQPDAFELLVQSEPFVAVICGLRLCE